MEIGTYIQNFISDELISNIIDLCPVGALVAMPSSFVNRS
jgi:NADH dehydrogenase/NADH:ubiquinone oxidoreductase subunit G